MKNLKLKTIEIVKASEMLCSADYQQLPDGERVKLWKIVRKLRPVAENYHKEQQSAQDTFKPSEEVMERFKRGADFELAREKGQELPFAEEEYLKIRKEYIEHMELISKALEELQNKEEEIAFEPLSEAGFDELIGLNKWSILQLDAIAFIVEQ